MNTITLIGKVSRAPEEKTSTSGKTFTVFSVEDKNDFDKYPSYAKVMVFGMLRDKISDVVEGALVCVIGKAKAEGYMGTRGQSAGKAKAVLSVTAREISVLAVFQSVPQPNAGNEPAPTEGAPASSSSSSSAGQPAEQPPVQEEDVPF